MAFVDIDEAASTALVQKISAAGHPAPLYRKCDVRDVKAYQAAIAEVGGSLGAITVLVNNAARDDRHALEEVTPDFWDERIAVNLRHQFFAIQTIAPGMKKAGGGSIVNFSSVSYHTMTANLAVYQAAKAAVIGMTRGLARDLGPDHIRAELDHAGLDHDPAPDRSLADAGGRGRADAGAMPQGEALSAGHRAHGAVACRRRQPAGDGAELRGRRGPHVSAPARAGRAALHVLRHMLPPTLYFFIAFNLIVFTTNLFVHDYWFRLSGFLVATTTALVVGKSVLVANSIRLIDRFRGAPLIQPILYKTIFYTVIVLVVRILERFIHLAIDDRGFTLAFGVAVDEFSWRRFAGHPDLALHLLPDLRHGDRAQRAAGRGPAVPPVLPSSLQRASPDAPPACACPDGAEPARRDDAARPAARPGDAAGQSAGHHRRRPAPAAELNLPRAADSWLVRSVHYFS